jgi:hypothetical protein
MTGDSSVGCGSYVDCAISTLADGVTIGQYHGSIENDKPAVRAQNAIATAWTRALAITAGKLAVSTRKLLGDVSGFQTRI